MKTFNEFEYKMFDKPLHYRADKLKDVIAFNKVAGTNYKYISEYIHKESDSGASSKMIAEPIGVTKAAISHNLRKMGVQALPVGGANAILHLSKKDVADIRESKESAQHLARFYKISGPTIHKIKYRKERWANY